MISWSNVFHAKWNKCANGDSLWLRMKGGILRPDAMPFPIPLTTTLEQIDESVNGSERLYGEFGAE